MKSGSDVYYYTSTQPNSSANRYFERINGDSTKTTAAATSAGMRTVASNHSLHDAALVRPTPLRPVRQQQQQQPAPVNAEHLLAIDALVAELQLNVDDVGWS
jgi:hypothetical protein